MGILALQTKPSSTKHSKPSKPNAIITRELFAGWRSPRSPIPWKFHGPEWVKCWVHIFKKTLMIDDHPEIPGRSGWNPLSFKQNVCTIGFWHHCSKEIATVIIINYLTPFSHRLWCYGTCLTCSWSLPQWLPFDKSLVRGGQGDGSNILYNISGWIFLLWLSVSMAFGWCYLGVPKYCLIVN